MKLCILGATGSIGHSTRKVVEQQPQLHSIVAATANRNVADMLDLCVKHSPRLVAMADKIAAGQLRAELKERSLPIDVLSGEAGLLEVARYDQTNCVIAGIVGASGLLPTLAATACGKKILLANKEALVMAGALFMQTVQKSGAILIPMDSEHNAIFQCLPDDYHCGQKPSGLRRILLTASGGPFRSIPLETLAHVTPDQACNHPNWRMGRKISVDSATMMNKGLEIIEACWLFAIDHSKIEVVMHPESIIHSMVEYLDGSIMAQLGLPDMRTPIAQGLAWPERMESGVGSIDWTQLRNLSFDIVEPERFPCLTLVRRTLTEGGGAGCVVLNAANEAAVAAFLAGEIIFTGIVEVVERTMDQLHFAAPDSIESIMEMDAQTRVTARQHINRMSQ